MNHRNNEQNTGKKNILPKKGFLVAGGILLAAAAIAGLVWGQFYIPLGCAFALFGILFLAMRLDLDNPAYTEILRTVKHKVNMLTSGRPLNKY